MLAIQNLFFFVQGVTVPWEVHFVATIQFFFDIYLVEIYESRVDQSEPIGQCFLLIIFSENLTRNLLISQKYCILCFFV